MSNDSNCSLAIFMKSTRTWVPVSWPLYYDYSHTVDAYIHKMRSHKCCSCPKKKTWLCDEDCYTCEFHCGSEYASLDAPLKNDNAEGITLVNTVADNAPSIDSVICDKLELEDLFARLNELMPEAVEIGKLRLAGYSDEAIAEAIDIKRTTFLSRLLKLKKLLAPEYPDFF